MLASRRFFTTIISAGVSLDVFLGSFVIFGMVVTAALVGPQFLNAAAYTDCDTWSIAQPGIPCPRHQLGLFKVAELLAAISVFCLFLAYVFNTIGLGEYESDAVRDAYTSTYTGNYGHHAGYAQVSGPSKWFLLGLLFTYAGVVLVLAAVCASIASATTRHDWAFKAITSILCIGSVLAAVIALIALLMRHESPITPPATTIQNGSSYAGPGQVYMAPSQPIMPQP